jgi:hypothetical protein
MSFGKTYLFLFETEPGILYSGFLCCLSDIEFASASCLVSLNPVRKVELPRGRSKLGGSQE